jgi:PfaB family protein
MKEFTQNKLPKIAIIGMNCFVSSSQELDDFERSIYQGKQYFTPINYSQNDSQTSSLPIPLAEIEKLSPQQQLMLKVADNTLKNTKLRPDTKIAVIMVSKSQTQHQDKLASYISRLWDATSPAFAEENSVFLALNLAQKLLTNKQVDAVLVAAMDFAKQENHRIDIQTLSYDRNAHETLTGEGAAAVVLQLHDVAREENNCIYAVIDALSVLQNSPYQPETVTQACQTAFSLAEIEAKDIGYLEVYASGIPQQDDAEIQGLITAYRTGKTNLHCALGSVKANIGDTHTASGIISLIKTALCLYHRYIPAVPQWTGVKKPDIWRGSPFYVATESKPWFLESGVNRRIAAINSMEADGSYVHLILSEDTSQIERSSKYLEQMPYYLFAIAAKNQSSLLDEIFTLQKNLQNYPTLSQLANQTFREFQKHQIQNYQIQNYQTQNYQNANYTIAILARNQEELTIEIDRAIQGVKIAFETGKDWQTPLGSYFTAKPQGKKGKVAFVYPGSFTSYLGIGRNLFRLFPKIYDDPVINNVYERVAKIEKTIYPRSINKLAKRQLEVIEQQLIDDPVTMLEAEVGIAGLMTAILKNYFQIQSQCAFGYSLGETSMMLAQGIWTSFKSTSDYLNSSPLFKTQLSGQKNVVRQAWGIPLNSNVPEFWSNYILICPVSEVKEAIKHENRVYIPLINTPEEVVIAGETQACKRVIENLKCDAFPTSINHVIHCQPMESEYNELAKINTLPIQNIPESTFYSAANYEPITIDSQTIGHNIAKSLCQQLDFPRLINRVYNDNIRIFIEVGVGSNCTRWINSTLKEKEHLAVSMNRRGVDDHTSIIRGLAKLVSHQVELDLSPLYSLSGVNSQTQIQLEPNSNFQNPPLISLEDLKSITHHPSNLHYQKLSDNNALMNKAHSFLLKSRQASLQQINCLIQQKIGIYKKIVEQRAKIK